MPSPGYEPPAMSAEDLMEQEEEEDDEEETSQLSNPDSESGVKKKGD